MGSLGAPSLPPGPDSRGAEVVSREPSSLSRATGAGGRASEEPGLRQGAEAPRGAVWRGATLRLLLGGWPALLVLVPLSVADVVVDTGLTLSYKLLIDRAILPRDKGALLVIVSCLAGGVVLSSGLSLYRDKFHAKVVARATSMLRREAFRRCQNLPFRVEAGVTSADLLARMSADLTSVEVWLAGAAHALLVPALSVLAGGVALFVLLPWPLALGAVLLWPLMLLGPRLVAPRAAGAAFDKKRVEGELLGRFDEALDARREIRAYELERFGRRRFDEILERLSAGTSRALFWGFLVERTTVISISTLQVLIVATGALLAFDGTVSVGTLVTGFSLFWNLGWSLVVLSRSGPTLVSALGSMRRLDELLDTPQEPPDPPDAVSLEPLRERIQFEDVWFAYPGRAPALRGVSFTLHRGEQVAIVGPSGSGKSTVLNLLAGFFEPSGGRILFDGVDLKKASRHSLRRQEALVFQETHLFDASVRENLRLGRLDASEREVEEAAREAEIHETIAALPGGYGAALGQGGTALSGGQRQRLAIARALVRGAPLLLLDEATSALDPATEAAVNETLRRAGKGRTTVAVTHRLAMAVDADRILVLRDGVVVEDGSHQQLLALKGVYAELWRKQNGFIVSGDGAVAQVTAERLRDLPLLRPLSDEQLAALARQFTSLRVNAGQVVITEGEPGNLFYIVARGRVSVSRVGPGGQPVELARLGDGDQFGEMALLRDVPRTATVTARSDCLFLTLTRQQFLDLIRTFPDLHATIERLATARQAPGAPNEFGADQGADVG